MQAAPLTSDSHPEEHPWQDLTLSTSEVIARARRWVLYLTVFIFGPFIFFWGTPPLPGTGEILPFTKTALTKAFVFLVVYLFSAVVHELLHALAMVLYARAPVRSIRFGLRWREGVAFVHTDEPMTIRAYRVVLAFPGVVLGLLPTFAGLGVGNGWLTFYGFIMLVSAVGDMAVLQLLQPFDADRLVRDHPREVGCQVR